MTPGTYYEFHIEAVNSSGNEDFAGVNATTLTLPPTNLTATAGDGAIDLSWTAPSFANSNGVLTYNIYRGTVGRRRRRHALRHRRDDDQLCRHDR